jgi:DNA polymerase III subunit epsilon
LQSDHANSKDLTMSSQIKRIDTTKTAGEIGALIRESDAIKNLMPVYNKQLRRRRDLTVALYLQKDGISCVSIEDLENVTEDMENMMAVYKSKKQAKENLHQLSRDYNLCPKYLGIESGKGACFGSQIGICNGVCRGDEKAVFYNARFAEAFANTRVKQWPFGSAIIFKEESATMTELHLIDKWCYLGSLVYELGDDELKVTRCTPCFDWDIYKILAKAVFKGKNILKTNSEVEEFFSLEQVEKMPFESRLAMPRIHRDPF